MFIQRSRLPRSLRNALHGTVCLIATLAADAHAAGVPGQGDWQTTLQARDLDGNQADGAEAYYDTTLGITWLADTFQARTSGYQPVPQIPVGSPQTWPYAGAWADNLTLDGITDWRLPKSFDSGAPGCFRTVSGGECGFNVNPASSEMAHLFYLTLGNISYLTTQGYVASGYGLCNTGPFQNVYDSDDWSQTAANTSSAWIFNMAVGDQDLMVKTAQGAAMWAVLDGDRGTTLAAVPEPGTWAMLLAGGLLLTMRQRRQARRD